MADKVTILTGVALPRAFLEELRECDPLGAHLTVEEVVAILAIWYPGISEYGRRTLKKTFAAWWRRLTWTDIERARERLRYLRVPRKDAPTRVRDDMSDAEADELAAVLIRGALGGDADA